jgi:DNA-binding SARP family transcriptional activator
MEFRVLGPVEVRAADRTLDIGHAKQRAVLAVLLLDIGRVVPGDVLIDRVWGENPPASVRGVLHAYIARLRAALATGADGDGDGDALARRAGGYVLEAEQAQVDVFRFRRLAADAARGDGDERARQFLDEALELWRGSALAGLDSRWLNAMRHTLELERHAAVVDLNDVRLRLGQHAGLAGELDAQAKASPSDERLIGQLMLALYRSGRQADALRCYDQTRQYLADELGTDPGPALQELHQQILRADPALSIPPAPLAAGGGQPAVPVPRELPADVAAFTGRAAELAALDTLLLPQAGSDGDGSSAATAAVISAVSGTAGVGKTALALHWAHHAAPHFPDGQLHVNLRGYDPAQPVTAADALAGFLRSLGVPGEQIPAEEPERAARYRSQLAGKRILIVLDNAATVDQVRPLLPGHPECRVLVTSRDTLAGLVARDGAHRIDLDLLPLDDAIALLRELIDTSAASDPEAVAELASQCARLPLALRIAAELAAARPATPLAGLVAELAGQQQRLDLLDAGGDPRTAVRAVFSWSCDHLDPDAARAFRLAGLHPGPDFDAYAIAALAGRTLEQASRALDTLTRSHLIQPAAQGRYAMHDLLRAYAHEQAAASDTRDSCQQALTRLFDCYLAAAATAMDLLYPAEAQRRPRIPPTAGGPAMPSEADARAWLNRERANLVAVVVHGASNGWPRHAIDLAATLFRYLMTGSHLAEAHTIFGQALQAARQSGDPAGEAAALNGLGGIGMVSGHFRDAASHYQAALERYRQCADRPGQARVLGNLGVIENKLHNPRSAVGYLRLAVAASEAGGDSLGVAYGLVSLADAERLLGTYNEAAEHLQRALPVFRDAKDQSHEADALVSIGDVNLSRGQLMQAADSFEQAVILFRRVDNPTGVATGLLGLGEVSLRQGEYQQAITYLRQGLALSRKAGGQQSEILTLRRLAEALHGAGRQRLPPGKRAPRPRRKPSLRRRDRAGPGALAAGAPAVQRTRRPGGRRGTRPA